ncbi:MAG TPA: RDD family protein [Smithella sp.]|nr:RDD family protein [Smithella sp.]
MDSVSDALNQNRCSVCGIAFPDSDLVQYGDAKICASCKPAFFQRLKEGADLSIEMNYAGFWIRAGAAFVDGIIMWIFTMALFFAFGFDFFPKKQPAFFDPSRMVFTFVQYAFVITYYTFFIGKFGATPGKMVSGIKVINADGGKVSYLKAFGRYFAHMLSGIILGIGYLMVAFDDEKRALHDRICNTRVIIKKKV